MIRKASHLDISLITSLYRAEPYLEPYTQHVLAVAAQLRQDAGLALEIVLVANEPTEAERDQIKRLIEAAAAAGTPSVVPLDVERETVYASWNRGVRAASSRCLGFWNVDDIRTADALIEGHSMITEGCSVVYFPYRARVPQRILGRFTVQRRQFYKALPYDRETFTRAMRGASFFMFSCEMYDRVGPFDEHFRISGDFEWSVRATEITDFCPGTQVAGTFLLHGGNLSDTGDPRQTVERNIIHLRRGAWDRITPADPDLMRACWAEWGATGIELPQHIQDKLWGDGARERWQRWLHGERRKRRRVQVSEAVHTIPRFVINRTGLRPFLARLGIVKSATIDR